MDQLTRDIQEIFGNKVSYGMFTDAGNAMIRGVVMTAKSAGLDWDQVLEIIMDIGTLDGFEEANDTAVRECVYMALQNG